MEANTALLMHLLLGVTIHWTGLLDWTNRLQFFEWHYMQHEATFANYKHTIYMPKMCYSLLELVLGCYGRAELIELCIVRVVL